MNKDMKKSNEKVNKVLEFLDKQKMDFIDLKILEAIIHEKTSKTSREMIKKEE